MSSEDKSRNSASSHYPAARGAKDPLHVQVSLQQQGELFDSKASPKGSADLGPDPAPMRVSGFVDKFKNM